MSRIVRSAFATAVACIVAGATVIVAATSATAAGADKDVCANVLTPQQLNAGKYSTATTLSPAVVEAVSRYKSTHELFERPSATDIAES